MKKGLILCLAALLACPIAATSAKEAKEREQYCGMLPEGVTNSSVYAGWSACAMRKKGEKPLWKGLPPETRQIIRFVFTHGHDMFYRVITITEQSSGKAHIRVSGTRNRDDYRLPEIPYAPRRKRLTPDVMTRINTLAEQAGVWDFEVGTWDKNKDGDEEIFLHCQLLEMERTNAAGYRFSSVNIGCNQPKKLMPLVNEIVRLAHMRNTHNGMLFE